MKILIGAVIGGVIGLGVGYFGKCASGTCPLTSDPVVSAAIGLGLGAMLAMMKK